MSLFEDHEWSLERLKRFPFQLCHNGFVTRSQVLWKPPLYLSLNGKEKKFISTSSSLDSKIQRSATGHQIYKCGGSTKNLWKIWEGGCCNRKGSFEDVWVLDKLKDEHKYCIIIDISLWKFKTSKYYVTISDTSGHRDYQEHD